MSNIKTSSKWSQDIYMEKKDIPTGAIIKSENEGKNYLFLTPDQSVVAIHSGFQFAQVPFHYIHGSQGVRVFNLNLHSEGLTDAFNRDVFLFASLLVCASEGDIQLYIADSLTDTKKGLCYSRIADEDNSESVTFADDHKTILKKKDVILTKMNSPGWTIVKYSKLVFGSIVKINNSHYIYLNVDCFVNLYTRRVVTLELTDSTDVIVLDLLSAGRLAENKNLHYINSLTSYLYLLHVIAS